MWPVWQMSEAKAGQALSQSEGGLSISPSLPSSQVRVHEAPAGPPALNPKSPTPALCPGLKAPPSLVRFTVTHVACSECACWSVIRRPRGTAQRLGTVPGGWAQRWGYTVRGTGGPLDTPCSTTAARHSFTPISVEGSTSAPSGEWRLGGGWVLGRASQGRGSLRRAALCLADPHLSCNPHRCCVMPATLASSCPPYRWHTQGPKRRSNLPKAPVIVSGQSSSGNPVSQLPCRGLSYPVSNFFLSSRIHLCGKHCTGTCYVWGTVHQLSMGKQQADNNQVSERYPIKNTTQGKATKSGQGAISGSVVREGPSKIGLICLWLFSEMTFEQRSPEGI